MDERYEWRIPTLWRDDIRTVQNSIRKITTANKYPFKFRTLTITIPKNSGLTDLGQEFYYGSNWDNSCIDIVDGDGVMSLSLTTYRLNGNNASLDFGNPRLDEHADLIPHSIPLNYTDGRCTNERIFERPLESQGETSKSANHYLNDMSASYLDDIVQPRTPYGVLSRLIQRDGATCTLSYTNSQKFVLQSNIEDIHAIRKVSLVVDLLYKDKQKVSAVIKIGIYTLLTYDDNTYDFAILLTALHDFIEDFISIGEIKVGIDPTILEDGMATLPISLNIASEIGEAIAKIGY